jgi:hypothetical protein
MSLNFDHNSNLSIVRRFSPSTVSQYEIILKICQFYSDSSRFFLQPTVFTGENSQFLQCRTKNDLIHK